MKKIFSLIAAIAALTMVTVSCSKESKSDDQKKDDSEVVAPTADFEYTVDGLTVKFTNKSQNATGYKWDFGDEETSKEANPTHEYAAAGEYTVKLTVANSDGVTAKKEATLKLSGSVKAYFSVAMIEGRDGEFGKALQFDATSSANAASIVWDFGDGESSTEFAPKHIFPSFGKYTVKATVTGEGGDTDTFSQEVECVKNDVLINGGSMEADDAQYWTVQPYWGYDNGQYSPIEGVYCYAPVFGCTTESLGHGACYKYESNPLGWDYNNKGVISQSFEVREGDVIAIDCLVKWGAETQDNGHFSVRLNYGEFNEDTATILYWFNNWWGVHDPTDDDPTRWTTWLPAFEGSLVESSEALADYGAGVENGEIVDGEYHYTVAQSGTVTISFFVDQVWGFAYGAGRDIYLDEVSVKAVVE